MRTFFNPGRLVRKYRRLVLSGSVKAGCRRGLAHAASCCAAMLFAVAAAVLILTAEGCATTPKPALAPTQEVRDSLGRIGVVSVGPALGGTLVGPVGVGSEAGKGAVRGGAIGGLSGAGIGAVAGLTTGPCAPIAVPVFAGAGALGGIVIGGGTGAVVNGVAAIPSDAAAKIQGVLAMEVGNRDIQGDLRRRFQNRVAGGSKDVRELGMGRAGEPLPAPNYTVFAAQGVDTILEIGVKEIALAGEGGSDPSLVLAIKARARLIRVPGNQVLWNDETLAFNSQSRDFSKWTADPGFLGGEIESGLDTIARQIGDKVL